VTVHAALWRHDGNIQDLGTLDGDRCSKANGINSPGQIVGVSWAQEGFCVSPSNSITAESAVLWQNGEIFNLNTVVSNARLHLVTALDIDDRGEIAGVGVPPGVPLDEYEFHGHDFLLIPCDGNDRDVEGCDYSLSASTTAAAPSLAHDSQHLDQEARSPTREVGVRNRFLGRLP
jgi:hypothetical protein